MNPHTIIKFKKLIESQKFHNSPDPKQIPEFIQAIDWGNFNQQRMALYDVTGQCTLKTGKQLEGIIAFYEAICEYAVACGIDKKIVYRSHESPDV